jgi:hypothetical protein
MRTLVNNLSVPSSPTLTFFFSNPQLAVVADTEVDEVCGEEWVILPSASANIKHRISFSKS